MEPDFENEPWLEIGWEGYAEHREDEYATWAMQQDPKLFHGREHRRRRAKRREPSRKDTPRPFRKVWLCVTCRRDFAGSEYRAQMHARGQGHQVRLTFARGRRSAA